MTTPITNGRHFFPARDTARVIFGNAHIALEEFQKTEFNASTAFDNFKNENVAHIDTELFQQDINQNIHYQAFLQSLDPIKNLDAKNFINRPDSAVPLIKDSEKKFQLFLEQQKLRLQKDEHFKQLSEADKERLISSLDSQLSKVQQPVAKLAKELDPDCLLSNAMRHFVNKMGKSIPAYAKNQIDYLNLDFTPRAQYKDSNGQPITMEYDKEGKAKAIHIHPYKGNVGDALALAIASHGKMLPLKVVVPISNADILKSEMDVGLTLFVILLAHSLFNRIEKHKQKNQVLKAAFEKGIPLDHISLVDNRGKPIPIAPSAQKRLAEVSENWRKNYVASLDETQQQEHKQPSPGLNSGLRGRA